MPATKSAIVEQIRRFRNHPNPPDEDGQRELANAFQETATSNEHLKRIADQTMCTVKFHPLPADIYEAAAVVRQRQAAEPQDAPQWSVNPVDRLLGEHWFYEIITDQRIEQARAWTQSQSKALREAGDQILRGVEARRASMTEEQWQAERRKAYFDAIHAEEAKGKRR